MAMRAAGILLTILLAGCAGDAADVSPSPDAGEPMIVGPSDRGRIQEGLSEIEGRWGGLTASAPWSIQLEAGVRILQDNDGIPLAEMRAPASDAEVIAAAPADVLWLSTQLRTVLAGACGTTSVARDAAAD